MESEKLSVKTDEVLVKQQGSAVSAILLRLPYVNSLSVHYRSQY